MEEDSGKMAQWLRYLAAFPEDLDSIPRTHMVAHNLRPSSTLYPLLASWGTQIHDTRT